MRSASTIFGQLRGDLASAQGPMVPQYWGSAAEPTHCGWAAMGLCLVQFHIHLLLYLNI